MSAPVITQPAVDPRAKAPSSGAARGAATVGASEPVARDRDAAAFAADTTGLASAGRDHASAQRFVNARLTQAQAADPGLAGALRGLHQQRDQAQRDPTRPLTEQDRAQVAASLAALQGHAGRVLSEQYEAVTGRAGVDPSTLTPTDRAAVAVAQARSLAVVSLPADTVPQARRALVPSDLATAARLASTVREQVLARPAEALSGQAAQVARATVALT